MVLRWIGWIFAIILSMSAFGQEVTLSLADYHDLRERVIGAESPVPQGVAFESAELDLEIGAEVARVAQYLTLHLLDEKWQQVQLPDLGAFVETDWGSGEGRLERAEDGWLLKLRGEGERRVRLLSLLPLAVDEGAGRMTRTLDFTVPEAGWVRGTLRVPEGLEVDASGGVVFAERVEEGTLGEGEYEFVAEAGGRFRLLLQAGRTEKPESNRTQIQAISATALRLGRERWRATSWVDVKVRRGALDGLRLGLPTGYEVLGVEGAQAGWRVEGEELWIDALHSVEGDWQLTVELVTPAKETFESALLIPRDTEDVLLASKIIVEGDGLLEQLDPGAGRRPTASDERAFPEKFRWAEGRALRLPRQGTLPRWQVTWAERTEVLVAQVDRLRLDVLWAVGGEALYEFWAEVRSAGAGQLAMTLPSGARLLRASRDRAALSVGEVDGSWTVPLALGEYPQLVHVAALVKMEIPADGVFELPLPQLSAPAALVEVRALLPDDRRYTLVDSARHGAVQAVRKFHDGGGITTLARQLGAVEATANAVNREPLDVPPAFVAVEASWSALSTRLAPLRFEVDAISSRKDWF